MTEARPSDYWFSTTAIYIQLNAVGDPNYIHANCSSGSVIMCYIKGVDGLGYDNAHNYRRWSLIASPTAFYDDNPRYVYIAIPKSESVDTVAQVVFPLEVIDLYGKNEDGDQVGPSDYYYINTQGIISASRVNGVQCNRTWTKSVNCGTLASDEAIAGVNEGTWWEYNAATDMVKFLKTISEAVFKNIEVAYGKFAQFVLGDRVLNKVADNETADDAKDAIVTPEWASDHYVFKNKDDVVKGIISFEQVVKAKGGVEFGEWLEGSNGAKIDEFGNGEVNRLKVRTSMEVNDLVINNINCVGGEFSFDVCGTIESIEENPAGGYWLTMERSDNQNVSSFRVGDIVYGYVFDLDNGKWGMSWMLVQGINAEDNILTVVLYPDSECPGGGNYPPEAGIVISHRGNNITANSITFSNPLYSDFIVESSHFESGYYNTRQTTYFIDSNTGRILEMMGVSSPKLIAENYACVVGTLPDGLLSQYSFSEKLINPHQPYFFGKGIVVQDIIHIDYKGIPIAHLLYRGDWSLATAQGDDPYVRTAIRCDYVSHNHCLWQCNANNTTDEPSEGNGSWSIMTEDTHGTFNSWSIIPSATVVTVRHADRKTVINPETVTCVVHREGIDDESQDYENAVDLTAEGVRLKYSLDGLNWEDYAWGDTELIELEDGSGVVLQEDNSAGEAYLLLGGDTIDTSEIGDRVYFKLIKISNGITLCSTEIPILKDGISFDGTDEFYLWWNSGTSAPSKTGNAWSENEIPSRPDDAQYRYLWNYEKTYFSNGDVDETDAHCISADGRSILAFKEEYALSSAFESQPAANSSLWSETQPEPTSDKPYLWNKETPIYAYDSNGNPIEYGNSVVHLLAQRGADGKGYEYIYKLTATTDAPAIENTKWMADSSYQDDEFVPEDDEWHDDPPQTTLSQPYCWYCQRKKVDGVWGGFSGSSETTPYLWSIFQANKFTSYIFCRYNPTDSNPKPYTPTGGSYTDSAGVDAPTAAQKAVYGSDCVWTDGPSSGNKSLWMSCRTFCAIESESDPGWSEPVQMTDTADFDVEFSSVETPDPPSGHPNTNAQWSNDSDDSTIWMATSRYSNGDWSDWNVVKIKGENGDDGNDAVFSRLLCGTSEIVRWEDDEDEYCSPESLNLAVQVTTGNSEVVNYDTYAKWNEAGYRVTFATVYERSPNNISASILQTEVLDVSGAKDSSNLVDRYIIELSRKIGNDFTVVDTLTIQVVTEPSGGKDGQGIVKSFLFTRSEANVTPTKPASSHGSFANPNASYTATSGTKSTWTDGIPNGTLPIWATTRIFTSDGASPQQSEWTDPTLMADSADFDVCFSASETKPTSGPVDSSGNSIHGTQTGLDKSGFDWHDEGAEDDIWMATSKRNAGNEWSEWSIVKVKGEDAVFSRLICDTAQIVRWEDEDNEYCSPAVLGLSVLETTGSDEIDVYDTYEKWNAAGYRVTVATFYEDPDTVGITVIADTNSFDVSAAKDTANVIDRFLLVLYKSVNGMWVQVDTCTVQVVKEPNDGHDGLPADPNITVNVDPTLLAFKAGSADTSQFAQVTVMRGMEYIRYYDNDSSGWYFSCTTLGGGDSSNEIVSGLKWNFTSDGNIFKYNFPYLGTHFGTTTEEFTVSVFYNGVLKFSSTHTLTFISVKDGAQGEKGDALMCYDAGTYQKDVTYTATETKLPYVLDEEAKAYYMLKAGKTYLGASEISTYDRPWKDAENSSSPSWELLTENSVLKTRILLADFAKIAASVFYGRYMMSQYGVLSSNERETMMAFNKDLTVHGYDMGGAITAFNPHVGWSNSPTESASCAKVKPSNNMTVTTAIVPSDGSSSQTSDTPYLWAYMWAYGPNGSKSNYPQCLNPDGRTVASVQWLFASSSELRSEVYDSDWGEVPNCTTARTYMYVKAIVTYTDTTAIETDSTQYEKFAEGKFTPYLLMDFLTGAFVANNAYLRGGVIADELSLGCAQPSTGSTLYAALNLVDAIVDHTFYLPALVDGVTRTIEILFYLQKNKVLKNQYLVGENDHVYITCQGSFKDADLNGIIKGAGLYKLTGFTYIEDDEKFTVWNVSCIDDYTPTRFQVDGSITPPGDDSSYKLANGVYKWRDSVSGDVYY